MSQPRKSGRSAARRKGFVLGAGAVLAVGAVVACGGAGARPGARAWAGAGAGAGAAAVVPAGAATTDGGATTVRVRYSHVTAAQWRAEYTFSTPLRSVAFTRGTAEVRDDWKVSPGAAGARIVRSGDVDLVVASAPFTTLTIDVPRTDLRPEKDYSPFYRYSDQGTLAYTGQLAVALTECKEGATCTDPATMALGEAIEGTLVLVAAPGETVVVRGQPRAAEAIIPLRTNGTYAYFGALAPLETADFVGVVDRGAPPWLRSSLDDMLPRLFAFYGDGLGRPARASERPTLFATFTRLGGSGRDLGGNVMRPRVVNIAIGLGAHDADAPEPALREEITQIFAHEVAHLWNADLYGHGGGAGSGWMHEGSADALAFRALRALGVLDEGAFRGRLGDALSLCVLSLAGGRPLAASTRSGSWRDFYECGSTIALLTEAAVKKHDPRSDLFTFWRAMFAGVNADSEYDEGLYFATLDRLGADPQTTAFVRKMTQDRLVDPSAELRAALARAGVTTAAVSAPLPASYERRAGWAAVRALLSATCVDALSASGDVAVTFRVTKDGACGGALRGDVVTSLAGVDLALKAASAFDAGYLQCKATRALTAGIKGKPSVQIPCAAAPGQRPSYLAIGVFK